MTDTKAHILTVAFNLFLQKNFKEVTMQEIVAKTKLSKGAFYHYFESKEAVFREVVEAFYNSEAIYAYQHLPRHHLGTFIKGYIICVEEYVRHLKTQLEDDAVVHNLSYFTLAFDAIKRFPEFMEKFRLSSQREESAWQEVVQAALDSGEIRSLMPARQIAKMFRYTVDSTFINLTLEGRMDEAIGELEQLWQAFYLDLART